MWSQGSADTRAMALTWPCHLARYSASVSLCFLPCKKRGRDLIVPLGLTSSSSVILRFCDSLALGVGEVDFPKLLSTCSVEHFCLLSQGGFRHIM